MKTLRILVILAMITTFSACGGGDGGGGGGGLTAAQVKTLYLLADNGTPMDYILGDLLQTLGNNCGTTFGNISINISGNCDNGGTWSLTGTANCKAVDTSPTSGTVTIGSTATDSNITLTNCASTVYVDTDGDGNSDETNITLNGPVNPFSFAANTTLDVTLDGAGDPTSVTINGGATAKYNDMQLSGDVTATASYTNQLTFNNFEAVTSTNPPTCAQNTVNGTEGGLSGTCTIQSSCDDCL